MIKMIKSAKNFSLDSFRERLKKNYDAKSMLKDAKNNGYELSNDPSYDILKLLFLNMNQKYGEYTVKLITKYIDNSDIDFFHDNKSKIIDIANDNFKSILSKRVKYQNNPIKYFEFLEKMLNFEGNKMYRKLYKLYDMVENEKTTNSSIINWDIHNKINSKSEGLIYKFAEFKNFKK